ncbi:unnamed protein product [Hermetia illucens]|uniref:Vacuolar protein sorting-associated protein 18 homolog n=1 Tax=Hermetia illucens TaxID=343691 RepID=A0A7R8YZB5_HERIL|nr:vacuolar protein sorting-associated protein 18 homolog isoform X2 [Hermetia illucens]CAD7089837.1 unnamed protein product [Hermetia illucens]
MTSLLDQNGTAGGHTDPSSRFGRDPASRGYVTIRTKEEAPIFSKQKMKLNLPHDIVHMTVANNWLVCLMSHHVLLRLFLLQPDRQDEVFLEKYLPGLSVSKLFLDPTGNHLLIALTPKSTSISPELLYLNRKTSKPKRIDKFRDHEITAVGFNYENTSDTSTGSILIGTSKGLIFETEFGIESGEKVTHNNWKQVFDIGKGKHCPITGIQFFRAANTTRFIVLVTTVNRLYRFHEALKPDEKPVLQNIFSAYLNIPEHTQDYQEIVHDIKFSKLHFNLDMNTKFPNHFGWMTGVGIYFGDIDQKAEGPGFILNAENISFPSNMNTSYDEHTPQKKSETPKTFILTNFHAILLYSDHVTAISLLNQQIIYEEYFSEQYGKLVDIIKDCLSGSIYVYSSKAIFRYKVTNEQRNVWQMYLDRGDFSLAEKYSKDNPAHYDHVLRQKAEKYFDEENYIQSALMYSETQASFERVCLKFLEIDDKSALMAYLKNRLEKLTEQDQTQITMLVVWMVELYLTEKARYSDDPQKVRNLQKNFDSFMNLPRVASCVRKNRTVIYDLMASHGDTHNLTMLTKVNEDYESVINQYINQNNFSGALSILVSQNKPELYYKYCPILMEEIPRDTIKAIMNPERGLDPLKLIPTLICTDNDEHVQEVIKFLEYAVHSRGITDTALHNFLIKLYAKHKQEELETYLETQGRDITLVHYDVYYALRVCEEHSAKAACVFLQCLLELWHPAVELALTFSSALAQETASQPTNRELRRKLWLRIAEHEIKGKNDVKKALDLLKECDLLRIEDLLPFFSDFQKIDDFKEAICDALKEYNEKIQDQQRDMDESAKAAERVRAELQTFRNRSVTISAQEPCSICEIYLLLKPFFIFPCGHKFHSDCLEKQIIPYLTPEQNRKLISLKQQLENMVPQNANDQQQQNAYGISSREQIKVDIENIIAPDCLYCGIMIDSIDQPFIEDWDQVNIDWQ